MNAFLIFLTQLIGYPIVLIGSIVLLGWFNRFCRTQDFFAPACKACNAATLLGLAAVVLCWLLSRTWTSAFGSVFDYFSLAAWAGTSVLGFLEVRKRWAEISHWLAYQTTLCRECRCRAECCKQEGCTEESCRCKDGCICH